ncbi:MAG: serine protease [Rhodospirillaceae bacterium]|nr:serine protease [Rhodospirillaceae bacterium]|tara:strand:- start:7965 stop:9008 length:1044 start_codon:yes stop_codon:yes gene_type:complete
MPQPDLKVIGSFAFLKRRLAAISVPVVFSLLMAVPSSLSAQSNFTVDSVLGAVVQVISKIPAEARTARSLGTERDGSGVIIDSDGLVLTIGYAMLEAESIEIVLSGGKKVSARPIAYDHASGFGLLRANKKLGIKPVELGNSGDLREKDPILVVSHGGRQAAMPGIVVSRRPFAGSWEYLLERAIYTAPPHPAFGGAGLFSSTGKLVGIGSLIVADAASPGYATPGNMFVPIDQLKPILGDLLEKGRSAVPRRPWLGLYAEEIKGRLFVNRIAPGGPASGAGIKQGDLVIGVNGKPVTSLVDFYRSIWKLGNAGVDVPLDILQGAKIRKFSVKSSDRYKWLKLDQSY